MSQENSETSVNTKLIRKELRRTRTFTPGRVLKVLDNGWVEIEPQIQQVKRDAQTQVETPESLPRLVRVPIGFYKAGGFVQTLPVEIGDEGMIIVADRNLELWKSKGELNPPNSARMHDISDSMFIPWPSSIGGAIQDFKTDAMYLGKEDGSGYVSINKVDGSILLKSTVSVTCETPNTIVKSSTLTKIESDLEVTGKITSTGKMIASNFESSTTGEKFNNHKHLGSATAPVGPVSNTGVIS